MRCLPLWALAFLAACAASPDPVPLEPSPNAFEFSDPAAWQTAEGGGGLDLVATSDFAPPHRSPRGLAILRDSHFGTFELNLEARSTGRQYGHRDLCLVFGYQDPAHYYYVHLAPAPDANAHNVFLVDGAPRRNLLPVQTGGMDWDDEWHHLRLARDGDSGHVAVYVDGSPEPILEATDLTLGSGRVGFGSFDDTGQFRAISVKRTAN